MQIVMNRTQLCLALFLAPACFAFQNFEVATIKPNSASDNRISLMFQPGGRFVATGISLKQLVAFAYDMRDFQVSGGPGWVQDDRYDINAKSEALLGDRPDFEMARKVMQNFLKERFQLKVHEESKEMQVYALVQAKGGSKMKASDAASPGPRMRMGRGQLSGNGISMDMLSRQLSQSVGRTVLDKTELKGNFDIELTFVPEIGQGGPVPPSADAIAGSGGNGPTVFTAVQEQLGLKLESTKGPVATLIIDSVSKPSEN
jgi:bla regulator protein blaR1